jgi:hypothetical protein
MENIADGTLKFNDSVRLVIAGCLVPSIGDSNTAFEKSIKWFNGSGGMGDNAQVLPVNLYWEVKGGGIRITAFTHQRLATDGVVTATDLVSTSARTVAPGALLDGAGGPTHGCSRYAQKSDLL